MATITWASFEAAVKAAGLVPIRRRASVAHWQIAGGIHVVNYYPDTKGGPKMYVAGAGKGIRLPSEGAAARIARLIMAATRPPHQEQVTTRRGSYRRAKANMMQARPRCYWCDCRLTIVRSESSERVRFATLDHRIPLAAGGLDHSNNWVLACEPCNQARGNEPGPPCLKEA